MRLSSRLMQELGVNAILDRQSIVSKTQLQLATGKRFLTPADDPAAASHVVDLERALKVTEQYQTNAKFAQSRLELEESVLANVVTSLHRVRELAIQGGNASQSTESQRALAVEVRELVAELLALANTSDANGEYLFSGHQGMTQPFSRNIAGGFSYAGDDGQRFLQIATDRQVAATDPGSDVFVMVKNGNGTFTTMSDPANTGGAIIDPGTVDGTFMPDTYTITFTQALPTDPVTYEVVGAASGVVIPAGTSYIPEAEIVFGGVRTSIKGTPADGDRFTVSPSVNQDIFQTVENLIVALEAGSSTDTRRAALANAVNRTLVDIDRGLENILGLRTSIGARLNAIEGQQDINDSYELRIREAISYTSDLDYAEATSRLNLELVGLQAAQQSFIRIQGLSLFNYLR